MSTTQHAQPADDDIIEIRYGKFAPILMLSLAVLMLVIGVWIGFFGRGGTEAKIMRWGMLPVGGILLLIGLYVWRLTGKTLLAIGPLGLAIPEDKRRPFIPWKDVEGARDVRMKTPNGHATYLVIMLHENVERPASLGGAIVKAIKKSTGLDGDLVLNEQILTTSAVEISREINRRVALQ